MFTRGVKEYQAYIVAQSNGEVGQLAKELSDGSLDMLSGRHAEIRALIQRILRESEEEIDMYNRLGDHIKAFFEKEGKPEPDGIVRVFRPPAPDPDMSSSLVEKFLHIPSDASEASKQIVTALQPQAVQDTLGFAIQKAFGELTVTIGRLGAVTNSSSAQLRDYEDYHILQPVNRDLTQQRQYPLSEIPNGVVAVFLMNGTHFNRTQIGTYFDDLRRYEQQQFPLISRRM